METVLVSLRGSLKELEEDKYELCRHASLCSLAIVL